MPDRSQLIEGDRSGFGGHEKYDEIKGEGNSLNIEFCFVDARAGRRLIFNSLGDKMYFDAEENRTY